MPTLATDPESGIMFRRWEAPADPLKTFDAGQPKPVLLLIHGLCGHSGRWEFLASSLLRKGFSSYALELKGFGATAGPRGHVDSFQVYFRDIQRLIQIIKERHPGVKIFCVGESMGALVALLFIFSGAAGFDGVVAISPAFRSKLKFGLFHYLRFALALLGDRKTLVEIPLVPAMCTRDAGYQKQMDVEDGGRRLASAGILYRILVAQMALCRPQKTTLPLFFLLSGVDCVVDSEASERFFSRLDTPDKTIIRYPDMLHALSLDVGREKVFEDIAAWLQARA